MKLSPWELPKALASGLELVYVILGAEPLTVLEAADAVRTVARRSGFDERVPLFVEPGFDWSRVAVSAASQSLFGGKRLLDLKLPNGKVDASGSRALRAYADDPPPDTLLLVTAPGAERKAATTAWAKAVERAGVLVECRPMAPAQLPRWVAARLRSRGLKLPAEAPALIAEYAQGNLVAAAQAVERLALLASAGHADLATVREAVVDEARYGLFDLADTLLAGDPASAVKMLLRLRETGTEPPLVLWVLARELRVLAAWSWASEHRKRAPQVWASRRELVARAARRLSAHDWQALLGRVAEIDRMVKGRASGDAWTELERLVLAISGAKLAEAA